MPCTTRRVSATAGHSPFIHVVLSSSKSRRSAQTRLADRLTGCGWPAFSTDFGASKSPSCFPFWKECEHHTIGVKNLPRCIVFCYLVCSRTTGRQGVSRKKNSIPPPMTKMILLSATLPLFQFPRKGFFLSLAGAGAGGRANGDILWPERLLSLSLWPPATGPRGGPLRCGLQCAVHIPQRPIDNRASVVVRRRS